VIYCRASTECNEILVSLSLGGSGENAVSDQNIDFKAVENDSFECLRLKDSNSKKERDSAAQLS